MNKFNGWLNLYKPKNISSAKFLSKIKYHFKGSKVGHTGTLDPLAEGVLPVAIGEATKLTDFLVSARKKYYFTMQFGARTDSADSGTEIIERTDNKVELKDLELALKKFIGEIEQTPSKYSAIKINGTRAYSLARSGQDFEMPARKITIYDIKLISFDEKNQQASIECECSKGTYIRTLAEDIAFSLNNLAFVIELRRILVGKFLEHDSIKLENSREDFSLNALQEKLLPVDYVLDDIPVIDALEDVADRIRFGQKLVFPEIKCGTYAVFSRRILCAIGNIENEVFKSKRVFNLKNGEK